MKNSRPIIQVLVISLGTMILSVMGMFVLIKEVRLEFFRLVANSASFLRFPRIPPGVWFGLQLLAGLLVIYLIVRIIIYYSIPSYRKAHKCPLCESHIQRIHRRKPERTLALIFLLRIGRFGCLSCDWTGLRRYHKHDPD